MYALSTKKIVLLLLAALQLSSVTAHLPEQQVLRAEKVRDEPSSSLVYGNGVFNLENIEARIQQCEVTKELTEIIEERKPEEPSVIEKVFTALFPFGPAWNALLATTYISGPPNLLLALIPPNIDASSLSTLVSFAVGGLLGDVFLHLLPQTFVGEVHDEGARFIYVDEKRNTILGLGMFGGFLAFVILDKTMRILTSSGEGTDGHSHGHSHTQASSGESTAVILEKTTTIRRRRRATEAEDEDEDEDYTDEYEVEEEDTEVVVHSTSSSAKLSAYLNMIADFTHNITDGLAISASFFVSKNVGATTCLAVFFHEIPHEVGDFALLIQGGFTKSKAMQAQFITAIGAYLGTFIGIFINYLATSRSDVSQVFAQSSLDKGPGVFGTNVSIEDLTLPFTAGGFLYIATVGVIPEILESHEALKTAGQKIRQALSQLLAMLIGIGLMFVISWLE